MPPPPPSTVATPPASDTSAHVRTQRRELVGAVLVGVLAVIALTFVIAGAGGSSQPPPATGAAALVPSDALLYVHLSTDTSRPSVRRALSLVRRLPDHGAALAAIPQRIVAVVGGQAWP